MTAKIKILFILTLSMFFEVVSAQTPPSVKRLPDYPNPIQGSCRDLRAAAGVGVKDSEGNTYAGACGYTQVKFLFDGLEIEDYVTDMAEKADKPYQITTYQDASGLSCARVSGIKVEVSGSAEVSYLDWLHNKPANSKCANEWNRLKTVITEHETKHVNDLQPVLNIGQRRLSAAAITNCVASGDPSSGILLKVLMELRDTWLGMDQDWKKHATDLDSKGDLCDINCCACNDNACYSGSFTAASESPYAVSFSGALAQHIELALNREDKDSQGRVIQQFYTLERGEFVYPKMVAYGEFDCLLNRTNFPLIPNMVDMTIFLNNPNFPKNSYHLGFAIDGTPVGTCHLRSDPKVVMTIPLSSFNFAFLIDCSTYSTEPIKDLSLLNGSFPNTCAGGTTRVDWNFKLSK